VVLDMVAGDYVARESSAWPTTGGWSIIAVQGGVKSQLERRHGAAQAPDDHRLHAAAAPGGLQGRIAQDLARTVWPLVEAGRIRPVIHQVFAAERAAEAHALMESSTHVGKIVLTW
jgi:NADPH:quinone reductase